MKSGQSFHTFMDGSIPQRGLTVPQPVYKATAQFSPLSPIKFTENGQPGMNLGNALRKQFAGLAHKDVSPTISETAKKVTIRINWPGYEAWHTVVHIVDHTYQGRPSSMGKLAHDIAKVINELKKDMSAVQPRDANWSLDKVNLDTLLLLELRHVSAGSWQPVLSLDL